MAYAVDQFDWLTRTWAQELTQPLNGGTFDDYLDTEKINDPGTLPPVGPTEADEIYTAETANLVDNFIRECHQALEGVRAFRLRTTAGGGTPLSIGSIIDNQVVLRSGTNLVGASAATPQPIGSTLTAGTFASGVAAADHVHTLPSSIIRAAGVYHESDWSALATNAFTDGTEVVGGLSYTVVQSALAGTSWGIVNGQGFVWSIPNNLARTWALASLTTAPYFYIPISGLTTVDMQRPLIVDLHLGSSTFENGNDAVRVGLWEPAATPYAASTARARILDRGNFGPGTSTVRSFDGTTPTTSAEAFAPNSVSIRVEPSGSSFLSYGTWSGDWPAQWSPAIQTTTVLGSTNSWSPAARIVFIFINAADATPTTTAAIANVRYRAG